jgi:hydrophobic/amphiphilic exporter-1 (mainly G- bacteria), HAE1 family
VNLPRFGVKNPVAAELIAATIALVGIVSWFTIRRDIFPNLEAEQISITVAYPGATPEDVERSIALRIEREIRDIDDVDEIVTQVFEGVALVLVKLEFGADRDRALNAVRAAVDRIEPEFPDVAEDPEIIEIRPFIPVISLMVSGDVPEERLQDAAYAVRDDLFALGGVTEMRLLGMRKREIWAEVQPERLEEHSLTFEEVGRAVARSNLDLPAGQLKSEDGNIRLRTMGEKRRALDLENIVVKVDERGEQVRLRDVAEVKDRYEDSALQGRFQGKRAISIYLFKTPEQDALDITGKVKQYVADHPTLLGGAVTLETNLDVARLIDQRIDLMASNAKQGFVCIILILCLFLNLRIALFVGLGVPVALFGTFTVMQVLGQSINLVSLFGLIIVIGMLVDDGIVIAENVYTKMQEGMDPERAAIKATREMTLPVLGAVLTTIIAFLPLAFMKGQIGQMLGALPVIVSGALLLSLVEAYIALPSHLAHHAKLSLPAPGSFRARFIVRRDEWLDRRPRAWLARFLEACAAWRYAVIASVMALLAVSGGLVAGGIVPFVFLQEVDAEAVSIQVEMAAGTPESRTLEVLKAVEEMVLAEPETDDVFTVLGSSFNDRGIQTAADPSTVGQVYVELLAADVRQDRSMQTSATLIETWRERAKSFVGVDRFAIRAENGSMKGADIEVRITANEHEVASAAGDAVREILMGYRGVSEVEKDLREGKLEVRLELRDSARSLGLTTADLALQVRNAVFGFESQELQEENDEMKVRILLPEAARRSLADLGRLRIATQSGGRVPLDEIASVAIERGYASLSRVDGKRAVTVFAQVDDTVTTTQDVTRDLMARIDDLETRFPGVAVSFQGQQKQLRESLGSLLIGFPLAMLAMYALIAMVFRSYLQPFIVMTVIPFSLIGAIGGHLLLGYPFTLLSMIGAVALTGVVVNDSIVLVDRVNELRRAGVPLRRAVIDGAASRLRAIQLTTTTTAAGMAPLILERSFQAQFLIPMAISLVFGLLFATVLTLVFLPMLYLVLEDLRGVVRWLFGGTFRSEAVEPTA